MVEKWLKPEIIDGVTFFFHKEYAGWPIVVPFYGRHKIWCYRYDFDNRNKQALIEDMKRYGITKLLKKEGIKVRKDEVVGKRKNPLYESTAEKDVFNKKLESAMKKYGPQLMSALKHRHQDQESDEHAEDVEGTISKIAKSVGLQGKSEYVPWLEDDAFTDLPPKQAYRHVILTMKDGHKESRIENNS